MVKTINVPKYTSKHFIYNRNNVRIIDDIQILEAVCITLSLGGKFAYESRFTEEVYMDYCRTIINTMNTIPFVDFDNIHKLKKSLSNIKFNRMNRCISINRHENSIKGYLRRRLYTTNQFFKRFNQINTIHTDKGNNMVVLYKNTYYNKLYSHLDDGVSNGTYSRITLDLHIEQQKKDAWNTLISHKK